MGRECETLREFCIERDIELGFDEPMARHTYLGIGGLSDLALYPDDDSLPGLVRVLLDNGIPYVVLGSGTNVLIKDSGIEGAVIFMKKMNIIRPLDERGHFSVQSGSSLQGFISFCSGIGLSGIDGLAGIPGTVGGAIAGNAGSFGSEMKDVVEKIEVLLPDGNAASLEGGEMGFGYRRSGIAAGSVIRSATVRMREDDTVEIKKRIHEYLSEKKKGQPLSLPSAGCVFKNPEGDAAGRLIDAAGCKGLKLGGIEVSRLHANFFVNTGKGKAADYLGLMDIVREKVLKGFGVELEPEIRIMGRD